jgi:MerR family transcriptional regulator, heat shock protein HspR
MMGEDTGIYAIGAVAALLGEHPETLRVWERHDLIRPDRQAYQRKYSENDLRRLRFIQWLLNGKGLNLAGVGMVVGLYSCWYKRQCAGGVHPGGQKAINPAKPCWKVEGTFCFLPEDKSEMCASCRLLRLCEGCKGCG